jgi:hypothetical protein
MHTVKSLREQGYKVRVYHFRNYRFNGWAYTTPEEKGGCTEVDLIDPSGKTSKGVAMCNPKDNYNKKVGVMVALGRAMKTLKSSQEVNEEVTF